MFSVASVLRILFFSLLTAQTQHPATSSCFSSSLEIDIIETDKFAFDFGLAKAISNYVVEGWMERDWKLKPQKLKQNYGWILDVKNKWTEGRTKHEFQILTKLFNEK